MRVRKTNWLGMIVGGLSLGLALVGACSASGGSGSGATDGAGASGASGQGGAGASGGNGPGTGGSGGDIFVGSGSGTGGGLPDADTCASVSSEATAGKQPADIIIAVDTSGSMDEEIAEVQANLNKFAQLITASGIDVHVVMIADATMCIPAPLGSGSCNGMDEKLPGYRHVVQTVASTDAFQQILNTYPQWKDVLRPNAVKTIAVVSDDDSDMSATNFKNQMIALDPTFSGFKFDAIVSFTSGDLCPLECGFFACPNCANPCCNKVSPVCEPLSAAEGKVYKELVQQTGGVIGDLCTQNFDPVFNSMATAVVSEVKISCDYPIPVPPDGTTIDPTKVNVVYTNSNGTKTTIYNVPTGQADCGNTGGWYYDVPGAPTKITMCQNTCAALQGDAGGKVEVLFGCETQVKPPE
ncbi:vWA domain-containing protein [Polyangium jinanense]|uniref:VWA domain-containing protein n=1 Tax=Polyangium jinanense TaxID=2829994 RepID=A0A9X3X1E2_9BACT|nr:vWA domain-containing protein [Polyangium jinanense]MDC3954722.1 VWA domain-containing protein [Polyangium jinanense]MDC3981025.1 VWA domain-containing protein [Polyangium jinanense]